MRQLYARPSWDVAVIEEDILTPDRALDVRFHIMAYEKDIVVVDGKKVAP